MKKYCIALLPEENSDNFIALTESFAEVKKDYALGPNSFPHVTIAQFYTEENSLDELWNEIERNIDSIVLNLTFNTFSCITFDNMNFWISLLPTETEMLHELNSALNKILNTKLTRPYDPHLTLLSTKDSSYKEKSREHLNKSISITDNFTVALGNCDDLGQFTKILYKSSPGKSISYNL